MDIDLIFYEAFSSCPWHDDGNCVGQVTYNQHVNDPRYGECDIHSCPIWHLINAFATIKPGAPPPDDPDDTGGEGHPFGQYFVD